MGLDWKQTLMAAGAAVGLLAVLHYLLKEEEEEAESNAAKSGTFSPSKADPELEMLHKILAELLGAQDKLKDSISGLTKELIATPHTFPEVYQKVQVAHPSDPMEKHGISMEAFDQLVTKHQNDPKVREGIMTMMGAPTPSVKPPSKKAMEMTPSKLVEVHKFMAEALGAVVKDIETLPNRASLEPKIAVVTAQAMASAKVEEKYGLTSSDLEAATMAHAEKLQMDKEFIKVNQEMQTVMGKLLGAVEAK